MRLPLLVPLLLVAQVAAQPAPSDEGTEAQWYLDAIGARGLAEQGIDGRGVVVAVLDSGVTHGHPDLAGRVWQNADEVPGNGLDDDLNGYVDDVAGWDMCHDAPTRAAPPWHHGTFVAGVVAADGRGHGGVMGVAPGATIMDVQVFCDDDRFPRHEGHLDVDAVREGLAYAVDNGAHIVQLSIDHWPDNGSGLLAGLLQQYAGLSEDFERAHEAGVLVVAAAGNEEKLGLGSPADQPHVLAVGATTGCGFRHGFSNHGPAIGIWAPGRALSTLPDGYGWDEGTSFAAPMVSGAAALLLQAEPGLGPDALKQRIREAARPAADGPALDLRGLFPAAAAPLPAAPPALSYSGPAAAGATHYLQFRAEATAPLLHVRVQGVQEWCLQDPTQAMLWIQPNGQDTVDVAARLHTGAVAGPWLDITLRSAPGQGDEPERPLLVVVPTAEPTEAQIPAGAALTLLAVAGLGHATRRRCAAPGRPPRTRRRARHG